MNDSASNDNNTLEEDKIFTIDTSFINPEYILNDELIDSTITLDLSIEDEDFVELLYLLNWMVSRGLFDKDFRYNEEDEGERLVIDFDIDSFLIDSHLSNTDEKSIQDTLDTLCELLENTYWTEATYDYELYSESEISNHNEFRTLEGEDPIISITLTLEKSDPTIRKNLPITSKRSYLND